jgi:signal peptidase I
MEPGLCDGDWLLVDPNAFETRAPRTGELVVAQDPRASERLLVKRVRSVASDGRVTIGGDHQAHIDEDISVEPAHVLGRPWFRYSPLRRLGRIT